MKQTIIYFKESKSKLHIYMCVSLTTSANYIHLSWHLPSYKTLNENLVQKCED